MRAGGGGLTPHLCASTAKGTKEGKCIMWNFRGEYSKGNQSEASSTGPQDWEATAPTVIGGRVELLAWGPGKGVLAASNGVIPYILDETLMQRTLNDGVAVIQLNCDSVKVSEWEGGIVALLRSQLVLLCVAMTERGRKSDRRPTCTGLMCGTAD